MNGLLFVGGPRCNNPSVTHLVSVAGMNPGYDRCTMRAFEVFLNGERLCVAGIDGRCVLTVIIDHVKGKLDPVDDVDLQVGGLISDTDEHVTWNRTHLQTGDEVRVRILDSDSADEPKQRVVRNS